MSRNSEPNTMALTFRGITYQVSCQTIAGTRNDSFYVCLLVVKTKGLVNNDGPSGGKRSQMQDCSYCWDSRPRTSEQVIWQESFEKDAGSCIS